MSYCRFSADNWRSDIYAYESDAGYVLHVAHNRIVDEIPEVGRYPFGQGNDAAKAWFVACERQSAALHTARRETIGGEFDGASWVLDTLGELRDKLMELRAAGYHVPESVFWAIDDELQPVDDGGDNGTV